MLEDGAAQSIETFQEAVQDVSIVLALDASGSMKRKESDVIASRRIWSGAPGKGSARAAHVRRQGNVRP